MEILFPFVLFLAFSFLSFSASEVSALNQQNRDSITLRFYDGLSTIPFIGLPLIVANASDTISLRTNTNGEIQMVFSPATFWLQTERGNIRYWVRGESAGEQLFFYNESGIEISAFSYPEDRIMEVYILREQRNEIAAIPSIPRKIQNADIALKKEKSNPEVFVAKKEEKKKKEELAVVSKTIIDDSVNVKTIQSSDVSLSNERVYKVQILTSGKNLTPDDPVFKGVAGVEMYSDQGIYKYTVGSYSSIEECIRLQKNMRDKGFKGAFVVVFSNGKRVR